MLRTRLVRSAGMFMICAAAQSSLSLGQEVIFSGSSLPTDQGWSLSTNVAQPNVSSDGTGFTLSTMQGATNAHVGYYRSLSVQAGFWVEIRLKVLAIASAPGGSNRGLGFAVRHPSLPTGTLTFDLDEIVFPTPMGDFEMDTLDTFHTYRMTIHVDGSVEIAVDGVHLAGPSTNGAGANGFVSFGDLSQSTNHNGSFVVESVVFMRDCNDNDVTDEVDISSGTSEDCNSNGFPDECETDCNENGVQDQCDINSGTSRDCNGNGEPDECESITDCNLNGTEDWCDISAGTSEDCNLNFIPDECDSITDCNSNGTEDSCDLSAGTSVDCNLNSIPDECDALVDCNANATQDSCDIAQKTSADCNHNAVPDECDVTSSSPDCNGNLVPDECDIQSHDCNNNGIVDSCDIASGFSEDLDGNGYPDECIVIIPATLLPDPSPLIKTRFVSFVNPTQQAGETGIRIWMVSLHHVVPPYNAGPTIPFTLFEGRSVWVGPPANYLESSATPTLIKIARTQCAPHYRDWSTVGLLHVTGAHIVPSSIYEVEQVSIACQDQEAGCSSVSSRLTIGTTRWGDVTASYNPPAITAQPDIADVLATVNKFRSEPGAPIKARALLAGTNEFGEMSINMLTNDYNFSHLAAVVDGFRGNGYPYKMGKCTGAPTPPRSGACTTNTDCTGSNGAGPCNLYCPD